MTIRRAAADDTPAILRIVRHAGLYPFSLAWPNFLVAEVEGAVAGVGQIRPHRDGCRELASLAVLAARQGQGVGSALVEELLRDEPGPVYLICAARLEGYYTRFGFVAVDPRAAPVSLRRKVVMGNRLLALVPGRGHNRPRIVVMVR